MPSRRVAIFAGVALLLALLLFRGIPYLTQQREVIASTPTPNAITAVSPIALKPRAQICTNQVTYNPDSQVARFVTAGAPQAKGPPLAISASGPGYRARSQVPGGYPGSGPVEVRLAPPNRSLIGEFCIRNSGRAQVVLAGTQEGRTVGRSIATVDGAQLPTQLSLTLRRAKGASVLDRAGSLLSHDAALNPMTPALVALLGLAVLILVPLGAFWALAMSFKAGDAVALGGEVAAPPVPFAVPARGLRERAAPAAARVAAIPAPVWLGLILFLAAVWFYIWAMRTHAFQNDEARYVYLARWVDTALPNSLWNFSIIDTGIQRLNIFIMAPIVGLLGGPGWVRATHAVNVVLFVSAAVPVYLIARGLRMPGRWALLAAVLTVFMPWAVLTTSFLTEPVAYPAFAWAIWAIWRAVVRPGWRNDVLAIALVVVAAVSRVNLVGLTAVLVLAVVAQELRYADERGPRARLRHLVRAHVVLVGAVAIVALTLILSATGAVDLNRLAGFYSFQNRFHVPTQLLTSKLDVYTTRFIAGFAFVPFVFGLAWAAQTLFRPRDPERFGFVVVAVLAIASIIYSSAGAGFDERYFIYYAPVFAVAFVVALGGREVKPVLVGAAGLVGALLLLSQGWQTAPQGGYSWFVAPAETIYANVFLNRLAADLPSANHVKDVAFVITLFVVAACVMAVSRHRASRTFAGILVAAVVALQFFQTQDAISNYVNGAGSRAGASVTQRSWIDQAIYGKSHAAILAIGPGNALPYDPIWAEVQFWNDSVNSVVTVGPRVIQVPPSDSFYETALDGNKGAVVGGTLSPYLVVPRTFLGIGLDAKVVKQAPYLALDLVKLRSRRLLWSADGAQPDGYMDPGKPVHIRVYRPPGTPPSCAHADVFAPFGLNSHAALASGGVKRSERVPATKAVRVELPLRWSGREHLDLSLTATGKTKLADGRVESVQVSGVGVERCPPGVGP
jgi:hypothetical protein